MSNRVWSHHKYTSISHTFDLHQRRQSPTTRTDRIGFVSRSRPLGHHGFSSQHGIPTHLPHNPRPPQRHDSTNNLVADRTKPLPDSQSCNQSPNTLRDIVSKMRVDMSSQNGNLNSPSIESSRRRIADTQEFEDSYPLGTSLRFDGAFA
jgi:hypothetical protein